MKLFLSLLAATVLTATPLNLYILTPDEHTALVFADTILQEAQDFHAWVENQIKDNHGLGAKESINFNADRTAFEKVLPVLYSDYTIICDISRCVSPVYNPPIFKEIK